MTPTADRIQQEQDPGRVASDSYREARGNASAWCYRCTL